MLPTLSQPHQTAQEIMAFLKKTYADHGKTKAVVAVSGGIDSCVSLTLVTRALGADHVFPVMLPYHEQATDDSRLVIAYNKIPKKNVSSFNIFEPVTALTELLKVEAAEKIRAGNIKARVRMIAVYDLAKQLDALVCGTENKSEKYLGYFTRFGDEASDIEPIQHLYKTQVRQLAAYLGIPEAIIEKAPSAGLWPDQTDEAELGFSYDQADKVLYQVVDMSAAASLEQQLKLAQQAVDKNEFNVDGIAPAIVKKVLQKVTSVVYKQQVPYVLEKSSHAK